MQEVLVRIQLATILRQYGSTTRSLSAPSTSGVRKGPFCFALQDPSVVRSRAMIRYLYGTDVGWD